MLCLFYCNIEPITPSKPAVPQEIIVPQELTNASQSSSDSGTLNLVVAATAGGVISVLLCIIIALCCMLCFRKKRKQNMSFHNPNYKNPVSAEEKTFPYEESRYEKIDTARAYSTVEKTSATHI